MTGLKSLAIRISTEYALSLQHPGVKNKPSQDGRDLIMPLQCPYDMLPHDI
jgi:hypothetical protein